MGHMIGIGESFPEFSLHACVDIQPGKEFQTISNEHLKGKWSVIFFWPLDFTFVCPTEIVAFNDQMDAFNQRGVQVFGASADSHYVHLAWRTHNPELKNLKFPMLSDYKKELSGQLGILAKGLEAPLRATYIVDPEGAIRWITINDLSVGRNVEEVLRTLDALQTGGLTPCNWKPGQATL